MEVGKNVSKENANEGHTLSEEECSLPSRKRKDQVTKKERRLKKKKNIVKSRNVYQTHIYTHQYQHKHKPTQNNP